MPVSKYDDPFWGDVVPSYIPDPYIPDSNDKNINVSIRAKCDQYSNQIVYFDLIRYIEGRQFSVRMPVDISAYGMPIKDCKSFISVLDNIFKKMSISLDRDIKRRLDND